MGPRPTHSRAADGTTREGTLVPIPATMEFSPRGLQLQSASRHSLSRYAIGRRYADSPVCCEALEEMKPVR